MTIMATQDPLKNYANGVMKKRVASLCLALGWNSAHNSSLDVSLNCQIMKTIFCQNNRQIVRNFELHILMQKLYMDFQGFFIKVFEHFTYNIYIHIV